MTDYRFLFDNDSRGAAAFFPKRRVLMLEHAGLHAKSSDREIVETASERRWIIVTANGDDFIAEIKRHLKRTTKRDCHDMYGLVILPNGHEVQKRVVPGIGRKLVFEGRRIGWKDVWELDCCVRIKRNGTLDISRFDRCFYCKKNGLK